MQYYTADIRPGAARGPPARPDETPKMPDDTSRLARRPSRTGSRRSSRNMPTAASTTPTPAPTSRSTIWPQMVRSERDFVVYDAKSGEDLTHQVLTQIIVEQESKGQSLLPISFPAPADPLLRQLDGKAGAELSRIQHEYAHARAGEIHQATGRDLRLVPFGGARLSRPCRKQAGRTWRCSSKR